MDSVPDGTHEKWPKTARSDWFYRTEIERFYE